jgi:hypothetical protein
MEIINWDFILGVQTRPFLSQNQIGRTQLIIFPSAEHTVAVSGDGVVYYFGYSPTHTPPGRQQETFALSDKPLAKELPLFVSWLESSRS